MPLVDHDSQEWELLFVDVIGTVENFAKEPIQPVIDWVVEQYERGCRIILWSGLGPDAALEASNRHNIPIEEAWGKGVDSIRDALAHAADEGRVFAFVDDKFHIFEKVGPVIHPGKIK